MEHITLTLKVKSPLGFHSRPKIACWLMIRVAKQCHVSFLSDDASVSLRNIALTKELLSTMYLVRDLKCCFERL